MSDHQATQPPPPRLRGLDIGDEPAAWRRAGFDVRGNGFRVGGVWCRLVGTGRGRGVLGWELQPPAPPTVDGLAGVESGAPPPAGDHPNGVDALDHVVVSTPDLERTTAALATIGLAPRRTIVGARGDDDLAFRFFLLGPCLLELIGPTRAGPEATSEPARFVGLAFATPRIEDLGTLAPPPRPAVQPGRRITTLDHDALGLSVPTALLSPR